MEILGALLAIVLALGVIYLVLFAPGRLIAHLVLGDDNEVKNSGGVGWLIGSILGGGICMAARSWEFGILGFLGGGALLSVIVAIIYRSERILQREARAKEEEIKRICKSRDKARRMLRRAPQLRLFGAPSKPVKTVGSATDFRPRSAIW